MVYVKASTGIGISHCYDQLKTGCTARTMLLLGRGDKLENFDLIFFPTSKTWKGLLTTN